jgi:Tetracyclin repressor-like, C-terminal domain
MALWGVQQIGDMMRRAAVGKSGDDAIFAVADACRAFALAHPGIYPTTQRAASENPDIAAAQVEVVDILVAVLAPYGFQGDDRLHAVRALRSLLHGFVDLEISGGFGMPLDRDVSFRQLVQLFIVGLHARQADKTVSV